MEGSGFIQRAVLIEGRRGEGCVRCTAAAERSRKVKSRHDGGRMRRSRAEAGCEGTAWVRVTAALIYDLCT
jgi:hypothetical protein